LISPKEKNEQYDHELEWNRLAVDLSVAAKRKPALL
jgi:hypothetical protein